MRTSRYKYWRVTFFMFYGGILFLSGWLIRPISAKYDQNVPLFIVQTVLILAGPPVYAAAEYNVLGRLMHYLPMHAPLNPSRVIYFFIYLGALVEMLTGTGAGQLASAERDDKAQRQRGNMLISISLVLQGVVEVVFICFVALIHRRASKAGMLAPNVLTVCRTLYCTSSLVLFRCIFRAVEAFESVQPSCNDYYCGTIAHNEWYILVLEALPMIAYTYWLNIVHPGRFLPLEHRRYLDLDGKTERMGPGWIEERSKWKTFVDPFDVKSAIHGRSDKVKFWNRAHEWPACEDGSFATGTATNVGKSYKDGKATNLQVQSV